MENLTYVTGNYGKYIRIKERFEKENIFINYYKCDLNEPNVNDIEFISKEKAKEAFEILNSRVFVADSGFYIDNYPGNSGYPGAFVKRSGIANDIDNLLEVMKDVDDRKCRFVDCLTFYDGFDFYRFYGISEGTLARSKRGNNMYKAKSNLWYIFIPQNMDKTLAEMSDAEINNMSDNNVSASELFIKWYKSEYLENKRVLELK